MIAAFGQPHRGSRGATITGRIDAELSGPVVVTYGDDSPTPGAVLRGRQTTKQSVAAGGHGRRERRFCRRTSSWGRSCATGCTGSTSGSTPTSWASSSCALDTPKNYRHSWATSAGVRVHDLRAAPGLELDGGRAVRPLAAPPETVTLDQPSFSHPAAHAGARFRVGRYRFGASYIHYWYRVPTITDPLTAPPSNIRGRGANNIFTVSAGGTAPMTAHDPVPRPTAGRRASRARGRAADEILAELDARARADTDWRGGRVFSLCSITRRGARAAARGAQRAVRERETC